MLVKNMGSEHTVVDFDNLGLLSHFDFLSQILELLPLLLADSQLVTHFDTLSASPFDHSRIEPKLKRDFQFVLTSRYLEVGGNADLEEGERVGEYWRRERVEGFAFGCRRERMSGGDQTS